MEQNLMSRQLEYTDRDDRFSMVKQDFSNIFYKHGLDTFTNPNDIGFPDYGKNFFDQYPAHAEDHPHAQESDNLQGLRGAATRDDLAPFHLNPSYSPLGLSHPPGAHFGFNGAKQQPYQQEHPGFSNYHQQNYYYQNHYDPHFMQQAHDGGLDYYHHQQDLFDTHNDEPLSRMWSNEPATKAMKYKNVPIEDVYNAEMNAKPKTGAGYAAYEQDNDEEKYFTSYNQDSKMNQMIKMQQDLSRFSSRKGLEPPMKGLNPLALDPSSLDVKNPSKAVTGTVRYNSRPSPQKMTTVEKHESFLDDDDDDGGDTYGDGKGRSTRGLRVLSLKVKEIVTQKKRTSYKEVAETLTHELRQKMTSRSAKEESKDEQNVKRRVYDALNVLIAADVLRKEGKVVYCDDSLSHLGFSNKRKVREDKEKLLAEIQEARKRNKAKIEALHELIFKCLAIKNLIKTNKERQETEGDKKVKTRTTNVNATRIDVVQENPSLKPKNEDVIRFPFIVLISSSPENSMNLNMDTSQRQLAIESKKPFNIFGDIDVLLKMGLHYVSKQMFDEHIPFDLQKYVPKYYLAALK